MKKPLKYVIAIYDQDGIASSGLGRASDAFDTIPKFIEYVAVRLVDAWIESNYRGQREGTDQRAKLAKAFGKDLKKAWADDPTGQKPKRLIQSFFKDAFEVRFCGLLEDAHKDRGNLGRGLRLYVHMKLDHPGVPVAWDDLDVEGMIRKKCKCRRVNINWNDLTSQGHVADFFTVEDGEGRWNHG